jgi:hypothetical protein
MSIGNQYEFIDFDFVELLPFGSSVLRLPRPHLALPKRLREGEVGSEEPNQLCWRARRSQNQFTPLGAGVNKLIFKLFMILYS